MKYIVETTEGRLTIEADCFNASESWIQFYRKEVSFLALPVDQVMKVQDVESC